MANSTIWKFEVPDARIVGLSLPKGAQVLTVQTQQGKPMLWALVDPVADREQREFHIVGTGWEFNSRGLVYIGTFQVSDGEFVFHVFEAPVMPAPHA